MRRFLSLVVVFLSSLVAFGQNSSLLKDAQDLFAAGDYSAAVTKFQEAVNKLSGRERNIAQIQLGTAQTCVTALSKAKAAESSKDFDTAINEYQKIIDANPIDTKVKGLQEAARKSKIEASPTLSVSKSNLSFSSYGGTQTIMVNCSMDWTLVDQTSSICSVSRSGDVITVICTSNSTTSTRNTSFLVRTLNGAKEQRISISQTGRVSSSSTTSSNSSSRSSIASRLEVKPTSISLSSGSGTTLVDVSTDANDYNVSLLPSWAKLKSKYDTFFSLSYTENTSTSPRSDWFNVTAGGETVKVTITQSGKNSSRTASSSPLNVKQTLLSVPSSSGIVLVDISTDASDYSISLLPSWCKVKARYKDFFSLSYEENTSYLSRSDWFNVTAGGKTVKVTITQEGKSINSNTNAISYRSSPYSNDAFFRIGVDFSVDAPINSYYSSITSSAKNDNEPSSLIPNLYSNGINYSFGLRGRIGRYDQLINLIGGARYVFSPHYKGFFAPVLLNLNLIESSISDSSLYLGGGYEFDLSNNFYNSELIQLGACGSHVDFSLMYKLRHNAIGLIITIYL